jgi:CDP-6-deoxy-D-xylo-4-hexulose-3-dehydrase
MIKLVSDTIDKEDINALCDWLQQDETPRLTKGSLTLELEGRWAEMVGTKYSVFVNSGSSALLLTLAALKTIGRGPKIVIPALSWGTDLSIPMLLNFKPTLCDCNLEDLSVDLEHLEAIFKIEKPDIFLLVPVLGLVPQMDKIIELCSRYNVMLLEDCCEAMGSQFQGNNLGTFGFVSMFSTFFGHHISTIEGGFINTNDEEFYHRLLMMRSHGWDRDLPLGVQESLRKVYDVNKFNDMYTFYVPGMNLRSTDLQAFIGLRSIRKLEGFTWKRQQNFATMLEAFKDINKLNLVIREGDVISNFAFPLVVADRKQALLNVKHKVETRPLIAGNLAKHPIWQFNGGEKLINLPNANLIHKRGLYLPNHQNIHMNDMNTMSELIHGNS